jgi:uncharacterized protein involved in exopolysaccharide biosynthesis
MDASTNRVETVSLTNIARVLWMHRWRVLVVCFGFTALAAAYAFLARPVYRVEVLVRPVTDKSTESIIGDLMGQVGGLASLVGIGAGLGENEPNIAVPLINSNHFLEGFIREQELLPRLFEKQWDPARKDWRNPRKAPTLSKGIKKLQRQVIGVREDRRRQLVTITVTWHDPAEAAKWAQAIVERVNSETRTRAIGDSQRSKSYLERELDKTNVVEIQKAIYRLMEAQIKSGMMASVRDDFSLRVIDPARVPDADDFVRPRRALVIVGGFVFGVGAGVFFALAYHALRRRERLRADQREGVSA